MVCRRQTCTNQTQLTSLRNVTRLAALAVALAIANVGRANPENFTVHSVTGTNTFTLATAKGKFVALHFLLKTECPYCIRHTHDYAQKAETNSNVIHIFLKPDTEAEIKTWATKLGEDALKIIRC